jgi:hypothetical protein
MQVAMCIVDDLRKDYLSNMQNNKMNKEIHISKQNVIIQDEGVQ